MCIENPSAAEVIQALEALVDIKRPYGENEGAAINSDVIFPYLSEEEQNLIEEAERLAITYTRRPVDRPDCDEDENDICYAYSADIYFHILTLLLLF